MSSIVGTHGTKNIDISRTTCLATRGRMGNGAQQALGELILPNLASSWNMTRKGKPFVSVCLTLPEKPLF